MSENFTVSVAIEASNKTGPALKGAKKGFDEAFDGAAKGAERAAKAIHDMRLGESISKASDLAAKGLSNLDKALERGDISIDAYSEAVKGIQDSFGLVSPASRAAAQELLRLDASLAKGEISADQYQAELAQLARSLEVVDEEAVETKRGLVDMGSIMQGVGQAVGGAAIDMLRQLPQAIVDLGKLGIESQSTGQRFERFAGSAGQATMFLDSFNKGTENTVDRMSAMSSAGRLLQMGLVSSGEEMEQVSSIATKLGDQTMSAGDRIADFAALLANQSIPRLDNFGISSGRVRQRIDELLASGQALNREEAFKLAVMEEGTKSLVRLGNTSDTAAHKIAVLQAAVQDAKIGLGEYLVENLAAVGGVEAVAESVRMLPLTFRRVVASVTSVRRAMAIFKSTGSVGGALEEFNNSMVRAEANMSTVVHVSEIERFQHLQTTDAIEEEGRALDSTADAMEDFADIANRSAEAQDRATRSADRLKEGLRQQAETAMETAEAHLGLTQQYTSYQRDATNAAESFTDKRAGIEETHQERLTEIAKKGQGWRKRVDEEGLRLETRIAEGRLSQLLEKQAEFGDETTDLERARTEKSIRSLQEEVQEKTAILETAQDGFIVMKGQNTDALLAEETRQYEESLTKQAEAQALQEEAQQQSLGRMILNHFNAWVEMNLAADGFTQEEAQFVTDMRNEIALEYGLITDVASQKMAEQENRWAAAMAVMRGEATSFFDFFTQKFNSLPSEKVIRIRTELATASVADPTRLGGETNAGGTAFSGGGLSLVGEQGPELAFLPRGASVLPADQSRHVSNNFNLSVNSSSSSMGVQNEFAMMQSLAA